MASDPPNIDYQVRKLPRETLPKPPSGEWTRLGEILPRVVERALRQPPTWAVVVDLCLELQAAREELARIDASTVEWLARERFRFYTLIGGSTLTLDSFRAKVRAELPELLGRRVDPPPVDQTPPTPLRPMGQRLFLGVSA